MPVPVTVRSSNTCRIQAASDSTPGRPACDVRGGGLVTAGQPVADGDTARPPVCGRRPTPLRIDASRGNGNRHLHRRRATPDPQPLSVKRVPRTEGQGCPEPSHITAMGIRGRAGDWVVVAGCRRVSRIRIYELDVAHDDQERPPRCGQQLTTRREGANSRDPSPRAGMAPGTCLWTSAGTAAPHAAAIASPRRPPDEASSRSADPQPGRSTVHRAFSTSAGEEINCPQRGNSYCPLTVVRRAQAEPSAAAAPTRA